MVTLPSIAMVFPLALLPFLYVFQHYFSRELQAQISIIAILLILMVILPFTVAITRVGKDQQEFSDEL